MDTPMKAHVINLDRRTDRWKSFVSHAKEMGIDYTRVSAYEPTEEEMEGIQLLRGAFGCSMSHLRLWKKLIESAEPYMWILEDDARQVGRWNWVLPESFDLFYLGCNDRTSGARVGKNLGKWHKVKRVLTTHAYIISREGAKKAIDLKLRELALDVALWKVQDLGNSYYLKPSRFIQNPDYSDILNRHIDYTDTI